MPLKGTDVNFKQVKITPKILLATYFERRYNFLRFFMSMLRS